MIKNTLSLMIVLATLILTGCVVVDKEPIHRSEKIVVVQEYPIINFGIGYNWYRPGPWRHYHQPMPSRHHRPKH